MLNTKESVHWVLRWDFKLFSRRDSSSIWVKPDFKFNASAKLLMELSRVYEIFLWTRYMSTDRKMMFPGTKALPAHIEHFPKLNQENLRIEKKSNPNQKIAKRCDWGWVLIPGTSKQSHRWPIVIPGCPPQKLMPYHTQPCIHDLDGKWLVAYA